MADALSFVYLHELGHTLMRQWGLPLWDNEDAADEFATAFLLMGKQQKIALQAAQWWASKGASTQDAVAKIWMDDRHSLSPQRARNIIHWVNDANDIVARWQHVFIPHIQTPILESMLHDPAALDQDFVKSELSRRAASH
jgi:Putative metallopeptidase